MQPSDSELVAAVIRGEQSGIAGIYDRYADRLNNYAWSVCRSHADAGDIVQDTFVTASQRLGQLRDPERLRPWLYAIARHHALRVITERQRVEVDSEIDMITDLPQPDSGLDAQQLVWSAAAGLDAKDRDILSLHLREGLDGEGLAAALGVKPNAANVALFRVRERLEHAVGALLLHRFARGACADLDLMMAGELTPLVRKRATRHIDGCEACQESRRRIGSPAALFAAMPAALAPAALRDTVLGSWGATNVPLDAEITSWRSDGFPDGAPIAPASGTSLPGPERAVRQARLAAIAGIVVVVAGLGLFAALRSRPDATTQIAAIETVGGSEAIAPETTSVDVPETVLAQPPLTTTESTTLVAVDDTQSTTNSTINPTTDPTIQPTVSTTEPSGPTTTEPVPSTTIVNDPSPPQVELPVNDGPDELAPAAVNVTVLEFECTDMVRVRLRVTGSASPRVTVRFEQNAFSADFEIAESVSEPSIFEGELEKLEGEHRLTARAVGSGASDSELLTDSCGQIS